MTWYKYAYNMIRSDYTCKQNLTSWPNDTNIVVYSNLNGLDNQHRGIVRGSAVNPDEYDDDDRSLGSSSGDDSCNEIDWSKEQSTHANYARPSHAHKRYPNTIDRPSITNKHNYNCRLV